ncbi:hypothetical protein [Flavobacterium sandaracinum]|uniref:Lipoprotein n=1 Tax=Flavobacterium sandaracinum TaxID=2541733 RepID=A0A4R5D7G2_9FLAO|nr:hypothetical protein [Flavobacterium sandaracinum]TDE07651.1 hypothetical protein E0F91_00765 [Flavobacterium sandaracinum]
MNQTLIKACLFLAFVTFSCVWISDGFAILDGDKKFDFYEQSEKQSEENNLEIKTKTLFLNTIESIRSLEFSIFEKTSIHSTDLFSMKEFALQKTTPPPKQG